MTSKYRFSSVDADHYQFHLQDANAAGGGLADAWTPEAIVRGVAVAPFIIGIGAERNTSVWLDLEVHDAKPEQRQTQNWRRIVECSLELPSGHLVITSPTLALSESSHVVLTPNCYRLRVHFGKISERGTHRYKILLWQEIFAPVQIIEPKRQTIAET